MASALANHGKIQAKELEIYRDIIAVGVSKNSTLRLPENSGDVVYSVDTANADATVLHNASDLAAEKISYGNLSNLATVADGDLLVVKDADGTAGADIKQVAMSSLKSYMGLHNHDDATAAAQIEISQDGAGTVSYKAVSGDISLTAAGVMSITAAKEAEYAKTADLGGLGALDASKIVRANASGNIEDTSATVSVSEVRVDQKFHVGSGSKWEISLNGTNLEFKYNGTVKFVINSA